MEMLFYRNRTAIIEIPNLTHPAFVVQDFPSIIWVCSIKHNEWGLYNSCISTQYVVKWNEGYYEHKNMTIKMMIIVIIIYFTQYFLKEKIQMTMIRLPMSPSLQAVKKDEATEWEDREKRVYAHCIQLEVSSEAPCSKPTRA